MGCFVLNPELRLANVLCLALNAAAFAAFFRCIIFEYYRGEINFEPTYISRSRMKRCSNRGKSWLRRERERERDKERESMTLTPSTSNLSHERKVRALNHKKNIIMLCY